MNFKPTAVQVSLFSICAVFALAPALLGQVSVQPGVQKTEAAKLTTLAGNTRPEATSANDRGRVADDFPMQHLQLMLRRSAEKERAAKEMVDGLYDPASPNYHKWLTTQQIADRFGATDDEIATVSAWLESNGFIVESVLPTKVQVEFSGTAGQIRSAFHTEIHRLSVNGESHYANMSDPQIPSSLASLIAGVISLNDFKPHSLSVPRVASADFQSAAGRNLLTPADLYVVYNFTPLFRAGLTGLNQTIYVAEDGDIYSIDDWRVFRKVFGLARTYPNATLIQINPQPAGGAACADPGVNGAQDEVALDVEYSSAAAPNASIVISACRSLLAAIENPINDPNTPAAVMSISYGEDEALNGAASNLAYSTTYQTGALKGWSIFVSSGDESAASADANATNATHGLGVSGLTSTPYNTSVGGTDFATTYLGNTATYWSSTNSPVGGNALSYIPEIPWDDSCANVLFTTYNGFSSTFGPSSYCNYLYGTAPTSRRITTASGSGGPSGCATGAATTRGVVSGTCAGWPKPSWQSVFGVPNDGVRDIPDVSLFAANGPWNSYYPACISSAAPCTGTVDTWAGFGGTSISSPIMAGIQALINQRLGSPQGLMNPELYALASAEYGLAGNAACNSTNGNAVASNCIFYDVTLGDIVVNCTGTLNCYYGSSGPSGTNFYGILSTSSNADSPAYPATVGYDYATGIGTVNAYNLVMNFGTPASLAAQATVLTSH